MNGAGYKIIKQIAAISEHEAGILELLLISWNGGPPVYDLRTWTGGKPGEGVTLSEEDLERLAAAIRADRLGKRPKK